MTLASEALAALLALNESCEGRRKFPYLDAHRDAAGNLAPIVTTGIGCALFTLGQFSRVAWQVDGRVAEADEILGGWNALMRADGGQDSYHYEPLTVLRLTNDAIDALQAQRISAIVAGLGSHWPSFSDWPWQAQAVAISIAYAAGIANLVNGWPKYHECMATRDYAGAIAECRLDETHNPGLKRRNDQNQTWMREAAGES